MVPAPKLAVLQRDWPLNYNAEQNRQTPNAQLCPKLTRDIYYTDQVKLPSRLRSSESDSEEEEGEEETSIASR